VREAEVIIPTLKHLVGNNRPVGVAYHDVYLQHGFPDSSDRANTGQVFLEFLKGQGADKTDISFTAGSHGDRSGALLAPNMRMTGLSRLLGPVAGDLGNIGAIKFIPTDFFNDFNGALDIKLFGVIPLKEVLKSLDLSDLSKLPRFMTEGLTAFEELLQDLATLEKLIGSVSSRPIAAPGSTSNPTGPATAVANDLKKITSDLEAVGKDLSAADGDKLIADSNTLIGDLKTLSGELDDLVKSLPDSTPDPDLKRSLQRLLTKFTQILDDTDGFLKALQAAEQLTVKFEWKPEIQDWPTGAPIFQPGSNHSFTITVELHVNRSSGQPSAAIYCGLRDFQLHLIAPVTFLTLNFEVVEFIAGTGKKPDVNVNLKKGGIEFDGPLKFVQTLQNLVPIAGFSDPPALSVTKEGINASYSLSLPDIGIGVFSLAHLSLGAGFDIPFIGKPLSVNFDFCQRQQPFLLTVSMFGGGGFFGLTLDPHGVQKLEAAFEFGASVSVNLGMASGGVYVLAGIYYSISDSKAQLEGYLRMGGLVQVLGIVAVSVELDMVLDYATDGSNSVVGSATLTIEITLDPDIGWLPAPNVAVNGFKTWPVLWRGQVAMPEKIGTGKYRLVVKEFESYYNDGHMEGWPKSGIAERLVYADIIGL
jgi:hypothetical protein